MFVKSKHRTETVFLQKVVQNLDPTGYVTGAHRKEVLALSPHGKTEKLRVDELETQLNVILTYTTKVVEVTDRKRKKDSIYKPPELVHDEVPDELHTQLDAYDAKALELKAEEAKEGRNRDEQKIERYEKETAALLYPLLLNQVATQLMARFVLLEGVLPDRYRKRLEKAYLMAIYSDKTKLEEAKFPKCALNTWYAYYDGLQDALGRHDIKQDTCLGELLIYVGILKRESWESIAKAEGGSAGDVAWLEAVFLQAAAFKMLYNHDLLPDAQLLPVLKNSLSEAGKLVCSRLAAGTIDTPTKLCEALRKDAGTPSSEHTGLEVMSKKLSGNPDLLLFREFAKHIGPPKKTDPPPAAKQRDNDNSKPNRKKRVCSKCHRFGSHTIEQCRSDVDHRTHCDGSSKGCPPEKREAYLAKKKKQGGSNKKPTGNESPSKNLYRRSSVIIVE